MAIADKLPLLVASIRARLLLLTPLAEKGAANGVAPLDANAKVPAVYLPSYVDDVIEAATQAAFPATGESGKIYVDIDTNTSHRWTGTQYTEISASPGSTDVVAEGATNKYFTTARVLQTVLAGLSLATATPVVATDTVLGAIGKLQASVSALLTRTAAIEAREANVIVKEQVSISNVTPTQYDLQTLLGALAANYNLAYPVVTLLVKDPEALPEDEHFINAEALAIVTVIDSRYVEITNNHTAPLEFRVRIEVTS